MQPDTFEAVRINVFNMLAELAQVFNEEQLDFLFKRFESSAARCDADNKQGMLLLFRLAKVDTQVSATWPSFISSIHRLLIYIATWHQALLCANYGPHNISAHRCLR